MSQTTDTPELIAPDELIARLPGSFERGLESGDLFFYESTTADLSEGGIDFEVRRCPALLKKPKLPEAHFDGSKPKLDPFSPPYPTGLLVGELHGEDDQKYIAMMNKFSVVKEHFLLITKEYHSQNSPPTPPDLALAYQILLAAQRAGRPFFSFFNCGDRSGASQPHKHLQFIPSPSGPPIERVAKSKVLQSPTKPFSLPNLPFAHFIRRLPPTLLSAATGDLYHELGQAFMGLLDLVIQAIRHDPNQENHPSGPPSYNVILTIQHLILVPRTKETHILTLTGDKMSINALGYAGMMLVKSEEEAEAVEKDTVVEILRNIGVPKLEDEFVEAHMGEQV